MGCMVVLVLIVVVAGGLYMTRERWTPWFKGAVGDKGTPKPTKPGDPNMSVYVEAEGYVYHRSGCTLLKNDYREITLAQARKMAYKACTKCNPPD